ncbi:MAG: UDP-N-acetylmuramate--L-alanine ligase [Planctomycetales bacterium]
MLVAGAATPATRPESVQRSRSGAREGTGAAHLIGVCGAGMKALAELLQGAGWTVSGSDLQASEATIASFARRGLRIHAGHERRFLPAETTVVVYSPAVGVDNPERALARKLGIPQWSYSQMLGRLMQGRVGVCIAGTHGKSTTTAMTGCILTEAELHPTVVIGAELCTWGRSGWAGKGPHFVVESCEYQRHFLDLSPHHVALLGIESDHFDCFPTLDDTIEAFARFVAKIPAGGTLLIPLADLPARSASLATTAAVETFGVDPQADWCAGDIRATREGTRFRAYFRGEYVTEIALRIPGRHNVLNALAALALAFRAGASTAAIREGLVEFPGIKRRFEVVGSWRGATLIDDYAHHPTAVRATLETARERYPGRRLWCVFQPHQVSRTTALLPQFAESLAAADAVLVAPVFAARERVENEPEEVSRELAARVARQGTDARFQPSLDHIVATLDDELSPGDVLIAMGAGDIGQVHHAFTRRLQRHHGS